MDSHRQLGPASSFSLGLLFALCSAPPLVAQGKPTFSRDVAPIIHRNCSTCHRPGEVAPFPLLTYDDVSKRRKQIARVVERGIMPPWLPRKGFGEFKDERRLSRDEVQTILRWVQGGAPEGSALDYQPPPRWRRGWRLGRPDLVLELPRFQLPPDGPDVFRNFVVPNPLEAVRFIRGLEFRPGETLAVHHAIIQVDATEKSRELDALDEQPGFPGMTMGASEPPDGHFLAWTPGKVPRHSPKGMSWLLKPGSDLVVQLHLTPTGKTEWIEPRIGLHFSATRPTVFPYSIVLFNEKIDIPAGESDYVVRDRYVLPVDASVLGVYPHAHYLARQMQARAKLPDGTVEPLFRIDDWDFNWQDEYRYVEPREYEAGTQFVFEYHFDNSADNVRNPHDPPQRVTFGQESTDEMATLSIQVVPRDPADRPKLELQRWLHTLTKKPWDWHAHNEAAQLLLRAGDPEAAMTHLRSALRHKPDFLEATCNLGTALRLMGRFAEAQRHYEEVLDSDPDHAAAHQGLGLILASERRWDEAIEMLGRAVELEPLLAEAHIDLANLLAMRGRGGEARGHYASALRIKPGVPEVFNNIGNTWLEERRPERAVASYRHAVSLRPDYFNARLNLGRSLLLLNRRDEALDQLRVARHLNPEHPEVIRLLENLLGPRSDGDK